MNTTETEILYLLVGFGWGIALVEFCWLVKTGAGV